VNGQIEVTICKAQGLKINQLVRAVHVRTAVSDRDTRR
jgi:hypothetical protein